MPVYNCESFIEESVESILNQTITDFEFLIIDDSSTDKTVARIKSYDDPRINLIQKPVNTGYVDSLNLGLSFARGKYVARMDGDDISVSERFAKQFAYMEENEQVVVCGSLCYRMGENRIIYAPENHETIKLALLRENALVHPSVMMRKEALNKLSTVYDVDKEPAEDYDLWVRLVPIGKLHNLQEVLLNYRVHDNQVTKKRKDQQLMNAASCRIKLLSYLNFEFSTKERDVFRNIFIGKNGTSFNEIEIFQQLKEKLALANKDGFFETIGFHEYLTYLEKIVVKNFCFKRKFLSPLVFFQYLKIKRKWKFKLSRDAELKLFAKSILFYKSK